MDHNKHNLFWGLRSVLLSTVGDRFPWFRLSLIKYGLWCGQGVPRRRRVKLWSPFSYAKNVRRWKFRFIFGFGGSAVAMHGHAVLRVAGHPAPVLRAVFPTTGRGTRAASGPGRCGAGGSRGAAGMGAVTGELEGPVARSLVQCFEWAVEEERGKCHDRRATTLLLGGRRGTRGTGS